MRLPGVLGWMAERSKALVLGTSLFGGVGSNPTPIINFLFFLFLKLKYKQNKKATPTVGLEPTTTRLRVLRSTN